MFNSPSIQFWPRRALFGGVLATLGATVGWLVYIVLYTFQEEGPGVLAAPLVGGAVGFLLHYVKHYLEIARDEARGIKHETHDPSHASQSPSALRKQAALAVSIGLGAMSVSVLACEHYLSHLTHHLIEPFLLSLLTFFPAGAILSLCLWNPNGPMVDLIPFIFQRILRGVIFGFLVAGVCYILMPKIEGSTKSFDGILSWWLLMSVCLSIWQYETPAVAGSAAFSLRTTMAAWITMAVILGVVCLLPTLVQRAKSVPVIKSLANLASGSIDAITHSPDMPSEAWRAAELEMEKHRKKGSHKDSPHKSHGESDAHAAQESGAYPRFPKDSPWGSALARLFGYTSHRSRAEDVWKQRSGQWSASAPRLLKALVTLSVLPKKVSKDDPTKISDDPTKYSIDDFLGADKTIKLRSEKLAEARADLTDQERTEFIGLLVDLGYTYETTSPYSQKSLEEGRATDLLLERNLISAWSEAEAKKTQEQLDQERFDTVGEEVCKGFKSGFVRSWCIFFCFALGLGLAPHFEARTRPLNYRDSSTRKKDLMALTGCLVLIVSANIYFYFRLPSPEPPQPSVTPHTDQPHHTDETGASH